MAGYRMIWRALGGDTLELTLVTSQVPPSAYRAIPPDDAHPRITISRVWAGSFDSGIPRCTLARRPMTSRGLESQLDVKAVSNLFTVISHE